MAHPRYSETNVTRINGIFLKKFYKMSDSQWVFKTHEQWSGGLRGVVEEQ